MSARHVGLLGFLAALWGASYLFIKYALEDFDPAFIVFARTALAAVVIWAVIRAQGGEAREAIAAALIAPASLFVAMLAPLLDRSEVIHRGQAGGLVIGLVGVALLVGVETVHSLEQFLGALMILGASLCYALGSFVAKRGYAGVPPMAV